jgi:hypothetical protein
MAQVVAASGTVAAAWSLGGGWAPDIPEAAARDVRVQGEVGAAAPWPRGAMCDSQIEREREPGGEGYAKRKGALGPSSQVEERGRRR